MKQKIISTAEDAYKAEKKHPNEWRKVLHELYKENFILENISDMNEEDNPFQRKLGISQRSLQKSIFFLKENKLIDIKMMGKDNPIVQITSKGFDVAREEQNHKLNTILQTVIIYFTSILVLTGAFELFNNLELVSKNLLFWEYIIVGVTLVFLYHFLIFRRMIR